MANEKIYLAEKDYVQMEININKAEIDELKNQIVTTETMTKEAYDEIEELKNQMQSFEETKSDIVGSPLGAALGMSASDKWENVVVDIESVVNRGAVSKTLTTSGETFTIPKGWHNGSGKITGATFNKGNIEIVTEGHGGYSMSGKLKAVTQYIILGGWWTYGIGQDGAATSLTVKNGSTTLTPLVSNMGYDSNKYLGFNLYKVANTSATTLTSTQSKTSGVARNTKMISIQGYNNYTAKNNKTLTLPAKECIVAFFGKVTYSIGQKGDAGYMTMTAQSGVTLERLYDYFYYYANRAVGCSIYRVKGSVGDTVTGDWATGASGTGYHIAAFY